MSSSEREWVLLVECYNQGELHTVRATLEAHGMPCQVQGEHTHGILGPIQGAVALPRVMVPRGGLAAARELVEDIVGPFDASSSGDDEVDDSPYRREPPPARPDAAAPAVPSRKSYGTLVLIAILSTAPLLGLTHVYAGKSRRGGVLLLISVFAIVAYVRGTQWAPLVLIGVWLTDLIGGGLGIAEHNARVDALEAEQDDEEAGEDDEDVDAAADSESRR